MTRHEVLTLRKLNVWLKTFEPVIFVLHKCWKTSNLHASFSEDVDILFGKPNTITTYGGFFVKLLKAVSRLGLRDTLDYSRRSDYMPLLYEMIHGDFKDVKQSLKSNAASARLARLRYSLPWLLRPYTPKSKYLHLERTGKKSG